MALFVDPAKRNTFKWSCASSSCIKSFKCITDSCGFSLLSDERERERMREIYVAFICECTICILYATNCFHANNYRIPIYHKGWFFARFIELNSSMLMSWIHIRPLVCVCLSVDVVAAPFSMPYSMRCSVCSCKMTGCPHLVKLTSNKILLHDCATH